MEQVTAFIEIDSAESQQNDQSDNGADISGTQIADADFKDHHQTDHADQITGNGKGVYGI